MITHEILQDYRRSPSPRPELKVGVNLATLLPGLMVRHVGDVVGELSDRGFHFVSMMPVRNFRGELDIAKFPQMGDTEGSPVRFVEDAWNPTDSNNPLVGLVQVARGRLANDATAPHLQDWLAFPGKHESRARLDHMLAANPNAYIIKHGLNEIHEAPPASEVRVRSLLEINPGMTDLFGDQLTLDGVRQALDIDRTEEQRLPPERYRGNQLTSDILSGVVFDTNHARRDLRGDELARMQSRPGRPVTPAFNNHGEVLRAIGNDVKLIDFQALNDRELQGTLAGQQT